VCELDQTLQNSYASHILAGKSLPFYLNGMYSVTASVPGGSSLFTLPIARGFTRLSAIYVTFTDGANKFVNHFYCPLGDEANTEINDQFSYNFTIGSERWPQFDCTSIQESAYRLRLTTAAHLGNDIFPFLERTTAGTRSSSDKVLRRRQECTLTVGIILAPGPSSA
jgi:hypothetical protein